MLLDLDREFPFHNTERIYKQLDSINDLLEKGVMVKLLFVCNNDIRKISFNKNDEKI